MHVEVLDEELLFLAPLRPPPQKLVPFAPPRFAVGGLGAAAPPRPGAAASGGPPPGPPPGARSVG